MKFDKKDLGLICFLVIYIILTMTLHSLEHHCLITDDVPPSHISCFSYFEILPDYVQIIWYIIPFLGIIFYIYMKLKKK